MTNLTKRFNLIQSIIKLIQGFGRWDAARAQLGTATVGVAGALTALATQDSSLSDGHFTSWILPFTAGGFLHISLVTGRPITVHLTEILNYFRNHFIISFAETLVSLFDNRSAVESIFVIVMLLLENSTFEMSRRK